MASQPSVVGREEMEVLVIFSYWWNGDRQHGSKLAKVELVDGEKKFKELDLHEVELSAGMDEFLSEVQSA